MSVRAPPRHAASELLPGIVDEHGRMVGYAVPIEGTPVHTTPSVEATHQYRTAVTTMPSRKHVTPEPTDAREELAQGSSAARAAAGRVMALTPGEHLVMATCEAAFDGQMGILNNLLMAGATGEPAAQTTFPPLAAAAEGRRVDAARAILEHGVSRGNAVAYLEKHGEHTAAEWLATL